MHSHLAIIGSTGELALKPDQSITVTDKNPMFNDVEMFTQEIPLPFDLNRHVLKNMDDVNSTMRSNDVQGERFQFVVDGIPFRNTAIKIQEGTKLDGTIDVNFDATNRTFKDMIADLRCRDVSVDDDILIGEKVGDVSVDFRYTEKYSVLVSCWKGEVRWLNEDCGIRTTLFMDDGTMVVPERLHGYALSLFPELRKRLAKKGVRMNEKKFYDQPYQHGFEFLGTHIKIYRLHLNNKTYDRAIERIEELNAQEDKFAHIDNLLSSFNSCSGLLKGRTDYKRLLELRDKLSPDWWQWLSYDEQRRCLVYLPQYSINERLNIKYHLKLKHYDTIRNYRAEECSLQRTQHAGIAA